MKKWKAKFEISGGYIVTIQAENENDAAGIGEEKMWEEDFGELFPLKNEFDDWDLLKENGGSYTFEFHMRNTKTIYFEAENETEAEKKVREYYDSKPKGILKDPKYKLLFLKERDQHDNEGHALIEEAVNALDEWFASHKSIETCFGTYPTEEGYEISELRVNHYTKNVMITVNVLDRPVSENDEVRGGDEVDFLYKGKSKELIENR